MNIAVAGPSYVLYYETIDIAQFLSPDLKSRMRAQDLKLLIENSEADVVEMDFHGVK